MGTASDSAAVSAVAPPLGVSSAMLPTNPRNDTTVFYPSAQSGPSGLSTAEVSGGGGA